MAEINSVLPWTALTADIDDKLLVVWNAPKRATQQALVEKVPRFAGPLHRTYNSVNLIDGVSSCRTLSLDV